jgi:arsenite methyltransferase
LIHRSSRGGYEGGPYKWFSSCRFKSLLAPLLDEPGGGFDCFIAAGQVGPEGRVVGVDMTDEMLDMARATASRMGLSNVEFRKGITEDMPIEDGWADVVISNGVINLCADKQAVFGEIFRVLRPGGRLQFADIANGQPVPEAVIRNIDLWTA